MTLSTSAFFLWLVGLCSAAALTDIRRGVIPNWLTLPTLTIAPLAHLSHDGSAAFAAAVLGALLCGLAPCLLFWRGAMGGGDVKLFAAAGALLGTRAGLELQLTSYLLLIAWTFSLLAYRGQLLCTLWSSLRLCWSSLPGVKRPAPAPVALTEMRMGPAILAASLCSAARLWLGPVP